MANQFTNIDDLLHKKNNDEALEEIDSSAVPQTEYLSAEEFVGQIVRPIKELQESAKKSVKTVKFNNVSYEPDENGVVSFNQMVESDSYAIRLASDLQGDRNIKVGDTLVAHVRYMAIKITQLGDRLNYREVPGTLRVDVKKEGSDTWQNHYMQTNVVSQDETFNPDDANAYPLSVDIGKYLSEGRQSVRIRVTSRYTDENGVERDFTGALIYSVNAVNLTVKNLTDWSKRILASDGGFPFSFSVMGAVDKKLHVTMTGATGTWTMEPKTFLADEQRPEANPYSWTQQEISAYGLLSHGVHTVTAWVTCSDGMGGELSSEVVVNRFMIVNEATAAPSKLTQPFLMLQGVQSVVENYVRTVISDFAVWVPKSAEEPTLPSSDPLPVSIRITNAGDGDLDYTASYFVSEQKAVVGERYPIDTTIEIENSSSGESPASYQAYLRVFRYNGDEVVNFLRESQGNRFVVFTVDNKNDYSPVAGAHFYLDPKVRNNTETHYQTIINKQTQEEVPSTWSGFSGIGDAWAQDDDGVKVLRIPSGRQLTIGYEPFEAFKTNPSAAMSLEMEFAVRNITAEDDPVISISQTIESTLEKLGIIIKPLTGAVWAQEKQNEDDQDFGFEEDKRVHLVVTLTPALVAKGSDEFKWQTPNKTPSNRPTVKVYINGKPQRAVQYSVDTQGVWIQGDGHGGIRLGHPSCDLDIYTIRCYRGVTLSAQNVIQNFTATRPDAATKNAIRQRNDILDGNGRVSYRKVKAKGKRCLTLVGTDNYKMNQDKKVGYACYWNIDWYDDNGNYVPELSGTLCKAAYLAYVAGTLGGAKCLMNTAQGSTANTYWWNNEQSKLDKVTYRIHVLFLTLHAEFGWKPEKSNFTDEAAAAYPLYLNGEQIQGDAVATLSEAQKEKLEIDVPDGWIDGNGMYHGQFYTPQIGGAKATKVVNKINYASPMQSHKMGATRLYNDVMKAVCKDELPDWMTSNPAARFAVHEEGYYFFNQPEGEKEPIFVGFGTFGSGKCDKATWGYDKSKMFAFEGLNNNLPLCDFRVPADEDVTYNVGDESWVYNGIKSFEYSLGKTNDDGTPVAKNDALFRRYCNFIYAHDVRMQYFRGDRAAFDARYADVYDRATAVGATDADTQMLDEMQTTKYWLRDGDEAFHLLRFNYVTGKFVDAGTWTDTDGYKAGVRDLSTDPVTKAAYEAWKASEDVGDYENLNLRFRMAIAASFNEHCGKYLNKKNHQVHYNLVNYLFAGTDNCSKNTYYTIGITTGLCWLYQDDLDTIFKTDNNGRQTKVYFLSRYFDVQDTEAGLKKQKDYEGTASALFNVMEAAWETLDPTALPANMREVLTAMCTLVGANEELDGLTTTQRQTPYGCLHKYFFSTQKYFAESAWAEQQRIRYDWPASWGYESYGNQARGVLAVTQGIGDQLESEVQYMTRRLALVCSYAAWGDFSSGVNTGSTGLVDASAGLQFTPGSGRTGGEYTFDLVPHQFIYPCGVRDRALINPHFRMIPGQHYTFTVNPASTPIPGDSSVGLAATNYYRSIGNVGNMVVGNNNFTIQGRRMTEFVAEPKPGSSAFAPKQIDVDAANLQKLSLNGVSASSGTFNLSKATRLQTLDLRGTRYGQVRMPSSPQLTVARFGAELSQLEVRDMPQLTTLTLDGYSRLTQLTVLRCGSSTLPLVRGCSDAAARLSTLRIDAVAWIDVAPAVLSYLASVPTCDIQGRIAVTDGQNVDATLKLALLRKFGDIDSESNALYVTYSLRSVTGLNITTQRFVIAEAGDYPYQCSVLPSMANNFTDLRWSVSDNDFNVTVDPLTGVLHAPAVGEESNNPTATLTVTATLIGGKTIAATVELKLFNRIPKLGDWAYYNGEFDSVLYPGKRVIGWVYKVTPYADLPTEVLNEYLKNEKISAQYTVGKTMYEVLIENTEEITITSSDNANSFRELPWGIYPQDTGEEGFTSDECKPIAEALSISEMDLKNIPALKDCTRRGMYDEEGNETAYIKDAHAYDDSQPDGFKVYAANEAPSQWNGLKDTASIVAHANNILEHYVGEGLLTDSEGHTIFDYLPAGRTHILPRNNKELADLCVALGNIGGHDRWRQLAYPAAYSCMLYEPELNGKPIEGLSEWFSQGHWYLYGSGDMVRLYIFFRNSRALAPADAGTPTAEFSDEDNPLRPLEPTDARRPCYANLQKRAQTAGLSCPVSNPAQTYRWSSTEYSSGYSWYSSFSSGGISNINKYNRFRVRPVVAFPFIL